MRTRGRTPAQRLVRRPLPREQCDNNSRRRVMPFWPVMLDEITAFRFPVRFAYQNQSGAVVDGRESGCVDIPVPTGPWASDDDA